MDNSAAVTSTPLNSSDNFPTDVLKWMKINAQPLFSLKLMQVCKYFKHKKFPYLVLEGMSNNEDGSWNYEEDEILITPNLDLFADCSLWITQYFNLYHKVEPANSILSKIAVCQARHFYCDSQNFTMNEFKALTECGTFEYVTFINTAIVDEDGNLASLESILQCLPNVNYISFDTIVPCVVLMQDAAHLNLSKLKLFEGYRILETFDFFAFTEFMKFHPHIQWRLSYDNNFILSPEYKQQLEQYIRKLLEAGIVDGHPPPVIHFPEQDPQFTTDVLHQEYQRFLHVQSI